MEEMKIVGDVNNFNITIVGLFNKPIKSLLSEFEAKGFYILSKDKLINLNLEEETIKNRLNIDNYIKGTNLQNQILANIFDLIDKGYKKIVINELLTFVDLNIRISLLKYLKNNNIRFVNITSDMEDTLLTDYLVVIYDGKIALEGKTLEVLKEERLLSRMGFNLPFIVDISIQLKYYGLVDKIYLNQEELVSVLWK